MTMGERGVLLFFKNLFIFDFWLHWVFVAARGLSLVVARGRLLFVAVRRLLMQWLLLLRSMGSRRAGFSRCCTQA